MVSKSLTPREHFTAAGLALAVGVCVLCFFTPRFVVWRSLAIPEVWMAPETLRAADTLKQIDDPTRHSDHPANRATRWRIVFPAVWHVLGLPKMWFLALPGLGCFFTLWLIIALVRARTANWWLAWWTAVLLGAAPWFFVSTGWLAYFDSWLMIGVLVACFENRRWALVLACVIMPFVDERFVLVSPLCMAIRAADARLGSSDDTWTARFRADFTIVASLMTIVFLLRIGLMIGGIDNDGSAFLSQYSTSAVLWHRLGWLPIGLWEGMRVGWLWVVVCAVLLARTLDRRFTLAVLGGLLVYLAASFVLIADLSRTYCLALPIALLGILMAARVNATQTGRALAVTAAINLLLPAAHIIAGLKLPISGITSEVQRYHSPPLQLNPPALAALAREELLLAKPGNAVEHATLSIRLDDTQGDVFTIRAEAKRQMGDLPGALIDAEAALQRLTTTSPERADCEAIIARLKQNRTTTSATTSPAASTHPF